MFDRFSTPARRVVFWARAEAVRLGSDWIEPEHLLLGLLAEDQRDWMRANPAMADQERIRVPPEDPTPAPPPFFTAEAAAKLRQTVAASAGEPKADMVDVPLARRSKQVLTATAQRVSEWTTSIGLLDILWALANDAAVGTVLASVGITIAQIEDAIRRERG